ncbi:CCA tRNA nucleotidyltransferase [Nitrosophilus kaiyonis]|uniref:CCA tRNA nucleotidyltransferase n=1 Tax=Nitrosophilus kaiyonis TaxID=2930200 RepID=UPI002492DACA|nr:CCA tRNA nucleotidyltransferase [Nitrosophilus kaiyonis]
MQLKIKHQDIFPGYEKLLPENLQKELQFLKKLFSKYTDRVYLVGGAVRDLIRKKYQNIDIDIVDLDIEVYSIEPNIFEKLMKKIGAKGVGKSFFVYKYKENIDISLPRVESKIGVGHKAFEVKLAKSEKEASIRRDFKMNALMLNVYSGKILDFWGGIEDIFSKRISIINEEKFKEDSLRVLRAMQFSARFGYKIEKKSCGIMKEISLNDLSSERIFWEFEKMFKAKYLHFGLYYLISLDIAKKLFDIELDKRFFLKTSKELYKNRKFFEKDIYKFYFLYIFSKNLHKRYDYFLDILKTPNEYYKIFKKQKYLPKNRTDRFLVALSMLYPLNRWLGNYKIDVKNRAMKFDIWKKSFDGGIKAVDLLKEGFSGKELGEELKRRRLKIIRKLYRGKI